MKKLIFILLLFPILINAETIDMEKAKRIALENNLELKAEQAATSSTDLEATSATFNLLPQANLSGSYSLNDEEITDGSQSSTSYGFEISQPIFNKGTNWFNLSISNLQKKIQKQNLIAKKLEVLAETETNYMDLLEKKRLYLVNLKNVELSEKNLESARVKFQNGVINKADYLKIQSELASNKADLIRSESNLKICKNNLRDYLQIDSDFEIEDISLTNYNELVKGINNLSNHKITALTDSIETLALANNPEVYAKLLNVRVAEKSLLQAHTNLLPSINLSYSKNWSKTDIQDNFESSGGLGIYASIPLLPLGDNITNITQKKYEKKQSEYLYEAQINSVKLQLTNLYEELQAAAKTVESSELALEYAEQAYDQSTEQFQNNMINMTELLDSQVKLSSAKKDYYTSYYELLTINTQINQKIGILGKNVFRSLLESF